MCDLRVGEWAVPERTEKRQWRDRLVAHAEQVVRHRLSFFDLLDRDLGDPIDWNRDHESGRKAPLRFAPLIDYLPESGYYLLQCGHTGRNDRVSVVFDCGELGFQSIAAHGHADALSFTLRAFGSDVFVDPGTYDYFSYPAWRAYFRSTRAHNTLAVDGLDQSVMRGPFLWDPPAKARCIAWEPRIQGGKVIGEHDGYTRLADPVLHRRTLELDTESRVLTIHDDVLAKGIHQIAVYFYLAENAVVSGEQPNRYRIAVAGGTVVLEVDAHLAVETLRGSDDPIGGWVSRGYHRKARSITLIARGHSHGNSSFVSRVDIGIMREHRRHPHPDPLPRRGRGSRFDPLAPGAGRGTG